MAARKFLQPFSWFNALLLSFSSWKLHVISTTKKGEKKLLSLLPNYTKLVLYKDSLWKLIPKKRTKFSPCNNINTICTLTFNKINWRCVLVPFFFFFCCYVSSLMEPRLGRRTLWSWRVRWSGLQRLSSRDRVQAVRVTDSRTIMVGVWFESKTLFGDRERDTNDQVDHCYWEFLVILRYLTKEFANRSVYNL